MALVTVEELRNYMDIDFSNKQQQGAQVVLDGLQDELEWLLRRPVEVGEYTETWDVPSNQNPYALRAPYSYDSSLGGATYLSKNLGLVDIPFDLHLDQSPIVSIQSITRVRPQVADKVLIAGQEYLGTKWGAYVYNVQAGDSITVEYTAGLNGENLPFLKLVLLRAAAREVQNLHDDVVGLKDLNTRNVAPLDVGFTDMEERRLDRYRRRRI